jgi:hypothetical protein
MHATPSDGTDHRTAGGDRPATPRTLTVVGVALALALLLAGCGSDPSTTGRSVPARPTGETSDARQTAAALPTSVQALEIEGTEYAFHIQPAGGGALRPGWTKVTFHNNGAEAHQVMFARLKEGVDLAQLAEVAGGDSSGSKAIEYVDMLGGVSYVGPGQTVQAMVDLPAGVVMAMCYVPDAHGVAHALSGMTTMLTVGGQIDPGGAAIGATSPVDTSLDPAGGDPAEVVQGTITMDSDGYHLPSPMPAGWYHVVNRDGGEAGRGLHELSVLGLEGQLDAGGLDQLLRDLAGNATPSVPLVALGGMGALSGGFAGYLYLDLKPGRYVAVDFMPDPGSPRPHLLDGYATLFQP